MGSVTTFRRKMEQQAIYEGWKFTEEGITTEFERVLRVISWTEGAE